jgi:hypothetical protein
LTDEQRRDSYLKLYYQFIKHGFGLTHSNETGQKIRLRLILDQIPENNEKIEQFASYLLSLSKSRQFQEAGLHLTRDDIQSVHSHDHDILQCLDIILGSIQFKLNGLDKIKPEGQRTRGKRTIAKDKLYKHISARIRKIYPGFNIGISTGNQGDKANHWRHSYRHWRFIPREYEDIKISKRGKM